VRRLFQEVRYHIRPAPLNDFGDYDGYWEKRGGKIDIQHRWEIAANLIEDGSTLLDVGAGTGQFIDYLRSRKPGVRCSASDMSARSVAMLRERGVDAVQADISRDAISGQFDYVTCFEVIEHVADAETALRHLKHAFRKALLVSVPNVGFIMSRFRLAVLGRFPLTTIQFHVKEHVRHWTPKDFRQWASVYGLRVVRMDGQYGLPYTPWKKWPSLFAGALVYVLERDEHHGPSK